MKYKIFLSTEARSKIDTEEDQMSRSQYGTNEKDTSTNTSERYGPG